MAEVVITKENLQEIIEPMQNALARLVEAAEKLPALFPDGLQLKTRDSVKAGLVGMVEISSRIFADVERERIERVLGPSPRTRIAQKRAARKSP